MITGLLSRRRGLLANTREASVFELVDAVQNETSSHRFASYEQRLVEAKPNRNPKSSD